MAESVTLTAPVFVSTGTSLFRIWTLDLRRAHPDQSAAILAIFREVDGAQNFILRGKSIECLYSGVTAQNLLNALNKANLSTLSLEKRVMQQCQTDGLLGAGAISGVPD